MKNTDRFHIFLDLDGVLALDQQIYWSNPKKWNPKLNQYGFDPKAVKVFNDICEITDAVIVLSSDWKDHYSVEQINEHFEFNGIASRISDTTPTLWGKSFFRLQELEECRATEIKTYVHEREIKHFVAIDDLDLMPWLEGNFVHTPKSNEGIKQSGVKEKVLNIYKSIQNEK